MPIKDLTLSQKTMNAILDTALELGLQRTALARQPKGAKTNTIGVIVHELNTHFITSVLAGIEQQANEAGYSLIITHSSESCDKEAANALQLLHKRVDGLIASLAFNTRNLEHFNRFRKKGIPVIFFDRVAENNHSTNVIIDNYHCGFQATSHLINQGCSNIALVTGSLERNVYAQRHQGYADALAQNNIPYNKKYVLIKDLSKQGSITAAKELLNMRVRPDGVFVTNDFSAAVCMQFFKDHGIRIPQDIAMVGFNDDTISKMVEPQLTTIRYPGFDMGQQAARSLIDQLTGVARKEETKTIIVHSELVIRSSSLKNVNDH
jgi:LacI family transcriptional regulator